MTAKSQSEGLVAVAGHTRVNLAIPSPLGANGLPHFAIEPENIAGQDLEVNLVLFGGRAARVLFVSVDILFAGPTLSQRVRSVVARLAPDVAVWLSATHTHRAPAMDRNKPALGEARPEVIDSLVSQIEDAVLHLLTEGSGVRRLSPTIATADMAGLSVHRRARGRLRLTRRGFQSGGVTMAPNHAIPVQREAVRVDWLDEAGVVRCVMWHWSCHPTAYPDPRRISSDYVGVVRQAIRAQVGEVPVLFFQGFAGDIRPPAVRTWRTEPLRRARLGPGFRRFTDSEYAAWAGEIAERILHARPYLSSASTSGHEGPISTRRTFPSTDFVRGSPVEEVVMHEILLGPLRLFGVSAEPSFGHLPRSVNHATDWYCGYLEDVYGYLPTEEQYREGGYEVDGFCSAFACEALRLEGVRSFSSMMAERAAQDVAT